MWRNRGIGDGRGTAGTIRDTSSPAPVSANPCIRSGAFVDRELMQQESCVYRPVRASLAGYWYNTVLGVSLNLTTSTRFRDLEFRIRAAKHRFKLVMQQLPWLGFDLRR